MMEGKKPSDVVPSPYGKLFEIYDNFNDMQLAILNDLLNTDKSIVLSAPTGSGKTVAFELAIVRMLLETDRTPSLSYNQNFSSPKAIYIAPIKALCAEIYNNWKIRFEAIGIDCVQLTGDTQSSNLMAIRQSQIIISTPEKWDAITRRWRDYEQLLPAVQLFIVDEVHLLDEDTRGPILETIVARMKSSGVKRFLVASATIPNVEDLTSWIKNCNVDVAQYVFNEMQRPVPLEKHVIGVRTRLKGFQFDMMLNYKLPDIIRNYADGKATLIFCSTRKSAEMAAFNLNKSNLVLQLSSEQMSYLNQLAQQLIDSKLKKLVEKGIAYHHAGLQYADRNLIELSFREGFLMALLSTSTLAMGINLPAHLVVIKSTETYMPDGYVEYPESILLQMIGRAGRPQYDTKGVAVILTQSNKVDKYKKLVNGKTPIESHLHKHLTEHLNSEIALNTITNLEVAMNWIRTTYLYVRSVRNPTHYGFPADLSKDLVEHKLEELSLKQINALESAELIKINLTNNLNLETTALGKLMAKYYISFETMKLFRNIQGNETLENIFNLLIKCNELKDFTLRVNEKTVLNALNKTPIRFPIKGRIKRNEEKISCIIQAILGNIEIPMPSLVQESLKLFRILERISKCLLEYVRLCVKKYLHGKSAVNNWYQTILNAFIAANCFHVKLWENTKYASKQLNGIGVVYSNLLANAGKTNLQILSKTDARTIEYILNKPPPFGDELLKNLSTFPEYEIKLIRKSHDFVLVCAKQLNENYIRKLQKGGGPISVLIIGDSLNNLLLWDENVEKNLMEIGKFERSIGIKDPNNVEYIYAHIIHISLAGVDAHDTLEINAPINKEKITKKQQISKKKTKQTRLNLMNKISDLDFFTESTLEEASNLKNDKETQNNNNENKLKKFQFSKPKLTHNEHNKHSQVENLMDLDKLQNIDNIKPLNESVCMNTTNETIDRSNQRKLTEFFVKLKQPKFQSSGVKIQKVDLINQAQKQEQSIENVTNPSKNESICSKTNNSTNNATTSSVITKKLNTNQQVKKVVIEKVVSAENSKDKNQIRHSNKRTIAAPDTDKFKIVAKKSKYQNISELKPNNRSCPFSLASFLGDIGPKQSITSMLEKENIRKKTYDTSQHIEKQKLNEYKKANMKNLKRSHKLISETLSSQKSPLNLSKKFKNDENGSASVIFIPNSPVIPIKLDSESNSNTRNSSKINKFKIETTNESCLETPTDEELSFWYTVALKFQRLPTQAMSMKNFRRVYNKMIEKEKLNKKSTIKRNASSSNKNKIKNQNISMEASNCSFRLQLFPNNNATSISSGHETESVLLINQAVMKQVLDNKCKMNSESIFDNVDEDIDNFDEYLEDALKEFQREFGP